MGRLFRAATRYNTSCIIDKLVPLEALITRKDRERRSYCTISDNESPSVNLNIHTMNARRLYCNFVDFLRAVYIEDLSTLKGSLCKMLSRIWFYT